MYSKRNTNCVYTSAIEEMKYWTFLLYTFRLSLVIQFIRMHIDDDTVIKMWYCKNIERILAKHKVALNSMPMTVPPTKKWRARVRTYTNFLNHT